MKNNSVAKNVFRPDYIMIPYPVYCDERLEGLDKVVYGIIYWCEGMREGKCYMSNVEIAKKAGDKTNIRSISNCLDRLEKCGYINRFYKDSAKRNRLEIRTNINFKKQDKPSASWNSRDSSLNDTSDSNLDEQSINKIKLNNKYKKKVPARSAEDELLIADIIDLFKGVNPTFKSLFAQSSQREAVWRMLELFGKERMEKMVKYLVHTNAQKYAPTITTPCQLERKMGELKAWGDKQRSTQGKGMGSADVDDELLNNL